MICVDDNGGGDLVRDQLLELGVGRVDFIEMDRNAGVGATQNGEIELARIWGAHTSCSATKTVRPHQVRSAGSCVFYPLRPTADST